MEGPAEEVEVTSSAATSAPAYSPHTQGFPPTSHPTPSNPFLSFKTKRITVPEEDGTSTAAAAPTTTTTSSFLRPSKLVANVGTNLFTKASPPADLDAKSNDTKAGDGLVKLGNSDGVTSPEAETKPAPPVSSTASDTLQESKDPDSSEVGGSDKQAEKPNTGKEETTTKPPVTAEDETQPTSSSSVTEEPKKEGLSYNAPPPAGFVFGSNLNDRVENISKGISNGDRHENGGDSVATPSTSSPDSGKRKWDSTCTVTTGEEDESNVMQASCRLFAFDVTNSSWIERGRGQLRLNDRQEGGVLHSRLIVRTKGSLRLMLNTPVFPQMVIERSSEKCIKITGHEDGGGSGVKLFLIQCSPGDAETLHSALEWRLRSILTSPTPSGGEETQDDSGGNQSTGEASQPEEPVDSTVSPPKKPKLSP